MKLTLPNYEQANVVVLGDIMLDRYWYDLRGVFHLKHRFLL